MLSVIPDDGLFKNDTHWTFKGHENMKFPFEMNGKLSTFLGLFVENKHS